MRQSDPAPPGTPSLVALAFSGRPWEIRRIGALSHVASTPFAAAAIEKLSLGGRAPLLVGPCVAEACLRRALAGVQR